MIDEFVETTKKVNMRDKDKREEVGKNILPPNKVVTTL